MELVVILSFQTVRGWELWEVVKNLWLSKMTYYKLLYLKWKRRIEIVCKMK